MEINEYPYVNPENGKIEIRSEELWLKEDVLVKDTGARQKQDIIKNIMEQDSEEEFHKENSLELGKKSV